VKKNAEKSVNKQSGRRLVLFLALCCVIAGLLVSCQRTKAPATKRYPFTGRVVSVDSQEHAAVIDGDDVPGFMGAMAMTYKIKPASDLGKIKPGDSISAEIVMVQPRSESEAQSEAKSQDVEDEYWIENVKVTGHMQPAPTSLVHTPAPGEDVPDFWLTNQSGKRISVSQYRGQVLLVTFIYTRCPFPDFCPRVSSNFAEIYKQMGANPRSNPQLAKVHLLSVSFDPEQDTPKVLRDYGFSTAHSHDAALFKRWEFAAPSAAGLPKIADYFGLMITPENGLITHNLSTAVIGPDGKIVNWYHGSDWQVSDLMKDAVDALARK
jgi:protein SCO1/2